MPMQSQEGAHPRCTKCASFCYNMLFFVEVAKQAKDHFFLYSQFLFLILTVYHTCLFYDHTVVFTICLPHYCYLMLLFFFFF